MAPIVTAALIFLFPFLRFWLLDVPLIGEGHFCLCWGNGGIDRDLERPPSARWGSTPWNALQMV
jgi:hypothetical protein